LENTLGVQYGVNADSMISYDGVYFGYAPNYDPQVTMADLTAATGQKGATWVYIEKQAELQLQLTVA
jgi:hypothetical protein